MKTRAWAPGHVTGFFEAYLKDNWELSGSRGAGLNIQKGIEAIAEINESKKTNITAPGISEYALRLLLEKTEKDYKINISFNKEILAGIGLGASGAEVISSLLAVNEGINQNFSQNQLINIAHKTEIVHKTGLGDVIAQNIGGVVIRKNEGDLNHSEIDKIPISSQEIYFYLFDEIKTANILSNKEKRIEINRSGSEKRRKLLEDPNLINFFKYSKEFALETGLAKKKVRRVLNRTEKPVAMTMLGQGIFSLQPIENVNAKKFFKSKVSFKGPVIK